MSPRDARFAIGELVTRTGVPAATIHHYRSEGLLPPAEKRARNRFLYTDRHVQAIKLIRLLRTRRNMPLDAMRDILPDLLAGDDEEAFYPDTRIDAIAANDRGPAGYDQIVHAAAQLFAARGFNQVSISDVAEAAGVAKGTVYRHVATKEDLFFAAVRSTVNDVIAEFKAGAEELKPGLDIDSAAKLLSSVVRPALPLLLELAARASQEHPGHPQTARWVLYTLVTGVGAEVKGRASERERGTQVLQSVIVDAFRAGVPTDGDTFNTDVGLTD